MFLFLNKPHFGKCWARQRERKERHKISMFLFLNKPHFGNVGQDREKGRKDTKSACFYSLTNHILEMLGKTERKEGKTHRHIYLTKLDLIILLVDTKHAMTDIYNISLTLAMLNADIPCLGKQCRSRSVGLSGSALFAIKFIATIQIRQSDWLKIRSGRGILILFSMTRVK